MPPVRIYLDTSVFGGCFDPPFSAASLRLFEFVLQGQFRIVVSTTLLGEIEEAPPHVRQVLLSLPPEAVEIFPGGAEVTRLRDAYLAAGALGDAEHVAAATVSGADLLVSWNFKHIVHYDKIRQYEGINVAHGHRSPRIHSPLEVVGP